MVSYDHTFNILLLGDDSVGKTSFTKQYCYNLFNPSERLTIGVDFHVRMFSNLPPHLKEMLNVLGKCYEHLEI